MENFGGEVTAEETPGGAVSGGVDVVLVVTDEFSGGKSRGTVGENSAALD